MTKSKIKQEGIVEAELPEKPLFDMSKMPVAIQLAGEVAGKQFTAEQVYAMMHRSPSQRGKHLKEPFTTKDYDKARPAEADPKGWDNVFTVCDSWYQECGLVRNIIDLMADFCVAGIQISCTDPDHQKLLRTWFMKARGEETSERIANMLYRLGNVGIRKLHSDGGSVKVKKEWIEAQAKLKREARLPKPVKTEGKFPYKYVILDPRYIKVPNPLISAFLEEPYYELQFSKDPLDGVASVLFNKVSETKLIKRIQCDDIKTALETGKAVPLDNNRFKMLHLKKDTNKSYAFPILYAAHDDLALYNKMKLADKNIVDSAIEHITFMQIGDPEKGLVAREEHVVAMAQDIKDAGAGGSKSYIVTPAPIKIHEAKGTLATFLGKGKFDAVLDAIYGAFGIPSALTGTATGAAANNYMAMKVLVKKLEYVRRVLRDFWLEEISQVCDAFGIASKVFLTYTYQELGDEAAMKKLIQDMFDRDAISLETYRYLMGADHELEDLRLTSDRTDRRTGMKTPKAGPFHSGANLESDLMKIGLQQGIYNMEDLGYDLEGRRVKPAIREPRMVMQVDEAIRLAKAQGKIENDTMDHKHELDLEMQDKQSKTAIEVAKNSPAPVVNAPSGNKPSKKATKKVSKTSTKKIVKKPKDIPGKGRPKNSTDDTKRKERTMKAPNKT